jgi:hypothetical protein
MSPMAANIFTATGCNIIIIIIILIINSLLKKVQYMNILQRKYRNCIKIYKNRKKDFSMYTCNKKHHNIQHFRKNQILTLKKIN